MTTPNHVKWVCRGVFKNTPEIWSFSLKLDPVEAAAQDAKASDFQADQVKSAIAAFFATGIFGDTTECTGWRAYDIGPDGKMVGNPVVVEYGAGETVLGNGSLRMPLQIALVVTTVAANRGHARFGRFYLPTVGWTLGPDARLVAAGRDQALLDTVVFLKAISNAVDIGGIGRSADLVNISNVGSGTKQTVKNVRIGRVLDTHRSRRAQLDEAYADSPDIDW